MVKLLQICDFLLAVLEDKIQYQDKKETVCKHRNVGTQTGKITSKHSIKENKSLSQLYQHSKTQQMGNVNFHREKYFSCTVTEISLN